MGENVYAFSPASLRTKIEILSLDPRITLRKPRASNQEGDLVVYGRSVLSRHLITQLWMWMSSLATKISPMVATQTTTRAFHGHGRQERSPLVDRPLFEEVRYMSLASTARKFDSKSYIGQMGELEWAHV
jgi:hypothetical protein